MWILLVILFLAVPIIDIIALVTSLKGYLSAKRKNRMEPGSVDEEKLREYGLTIIISGIIAIILISIVIGYTVSIRQSVNFM